MNSSKFALQQGQSVLIAGSRYPYSGHLDAVEQVIARMQKIEATLICGDAKGIDTLAARHAVDRAIPVKVYGIGRGPRKEFLQQVKGGFTYIQVQLPKNLPVRTKFAIRDTTMSFDADFRIFFWNGANKYGGTFQGWANSVRNGYPAVLYNREKRLDNGF